MDYQLLHQKVKEAGMMKVAEALGITHFGLLKALRNKKIWVHHLEVIAKGCDMPISAFFEKEDQVDEDQVDEDQILELLT